MVQVGNLNPKWSAQMVQVGKSQSQMLGANGPGGNFNILFVLPTANDVGERGCAVGERERDHLNARDATPAPQ